MQKPEVSIARARSLLGQHLPYILGGGGRNPGALTPATDVYRDDGTLVGRGCDCIGFVAWCCGFDRFQRGFPYYGGWINCDSALGGWYQGPNGMEWHPAARYFRVLPRPQPGCWLVYPSIDLDHDGKRDRIGHVGLVESCVPPDQTWSWQTTTVLQCSSTASRQTNGNSITRTDAQLWGKAEYYKGHSSPRWAAVFLEPLI